MAIGLLAVLAVAVGCGSDSDDGDGGGGGGGGDKSPVKIGLLVSVSGNYASIGSPMVDGAQLWLAEHGNKVGGHPAEIIVADDKSTTNGMVTAANSLIREHDVTAVIGLDNSAAAVATTPALMRAKVPTMSVVANAEPLLDTTRNPYMFMVTPMQGQTAAPSAVLAQTQKWQGGVVGVADNYIGARGWLDASLDAMEDLGMTVKSRSYPPFPTSDYGPYIAKARDAGLVFPVMYGPGALSFMKSYSSFGATAPIYTTGSVFEPVETSADVLKAADGAYVFWSYWPGLDQPENEKFVDAFEQKYDVAPGAFSMGAYASLSLLDKAYEQAGGTDPEAVKAALEKVTASSPVGDIGLGAEHAVNWPMYLLRIEKQPDGSYGFSPVGPYIKETTLTMTTDEAEAQLSELPGN